MKKKGKEEERNRCEKEWIESSEGGKEGGRGKWLNWLGGLAYELGFQLGLKGVFPFFNLFLLLVLKACIRDSREGYFLKIFT